uniref:G2 and S phase-expressed protein 1 N-terminal domain-containing protein n=1 Tax=Periophthalmus magnuspinnatus TaxID=409849 RepID=A0A3B4A708_9GOBI
MLFSSIIQLILNIFPHFLHSSTGEDFEDEVFVGPIGHTERCVSVNVASRLENLCVQTSWSPLSGDQLEAICEEAQKLANQLQSSEHAHMLCDSPPTVLSPIKRQTFCVQDSPLKQLPPHRRSVAVQPSVPPFSAAGRRSLSVQTRKTSNPTPLKRPQCSPVQTPVRRGIDRTSSVPSVTKIQSGLKAKPKPQALVPSPNGTLQGG